MRHVLALVALGFAAASCSSTENPARPAPVTDAGAPGLKCLDLAHGCHYVDFGEPGPIHECHNWGHEGPESMCSAEHDRCLNLCAAKRLELGIDENGNPLDAGPDARIAGGDAQSPDAGDHRDSGSPSDATTRDATPRDAGHTVDATPPVHTDASLSGAEMCVQLGNICHKVDPGSGPIHECHNIGHDGVIAKCVANYARCIPLCTNLSP